jgi:tetratricopeptide (TPR) repeat protein
MLENADPSTPCRPDPQKKRVGEEWRHSAQDDSSTGVNGTPFDKLRAGSEGVPFQNAAAAEAAPRQPVTAAEHTLTRTGLAMGTAGYMSPEQVRGEKLDARSDIFSLGLVLYQMATGQRAFRGETAALVHNAILNNSPVSPRELNSATPAKLVTVIDKALEKDRNHRYQAVAEMRDALEWVEEEGKSSRPQSTKRRSRWLAAAACVVALAAGGVLYWRFRSTAGLRAGDTVVVADFENNTGEPALNDALKVALKTELAQSPFLDVLGSDKTRSTLELMRHGEDERLTPGLALQLCARTNSAAVVAGSIADEGNNYHIALKAVNCRTGNTVASVAENAKSRTVVVKTLGNLGAELRDKLGEPRSSLQQFNRPLDEAMTPSIEALQAFSQAEETQMKKSSLPSIPLFRRATDLDPNFALAWMYLGIMYGRVDDDRLQSEYLTRAYQLRSRLSRRDKFAIEASYSMAEGDIQKAIPIYKQWLQNYPRDRIALINLAKLDNLVAENSEAASLLREAIRLDSNDFNTYFELIFTALLMDRIDEAVAIYDEAKAQKIEIDTLAGPRFQIAFYQHDKATMQELSRSNVADPFRRTMFLGTRARVEEYYGRFRNARRLWAQVKDYSNPNDMPWNSWLLSAQALSEAVAGNSSLALSLAKEALAESRSRTDNGRAALSLAFAGDDNQAETQARAIDREYPVDTILQNFWLPTTRAVVELHRNHPDAAVRELQRDSRYEQFGSMMPSYVRGEAYLKLGLSAQAAEEFKRVLAHPTWTNVWVFGATAHLQLGRAQVMMGDKAAARKSYQDFLTLWKDADPDIPIYQQAKAEYAKLQ